MSITLKEVETAYKKLKTYIYYDNSNLLLRKKLVEFESFEIGSKYQIDIKNDTHKIVKKKLKKICTELKEERSDFLHQIIKKIDISFFPKTYQKDKSDKNFISNERIKDKYQVERLLAMVDAPIEVHIISVLWIMKYGAEIDAKLSDSCKGNRLILNKNNQLVKGSGLFKPYFRQYQSWRDSAVSEAQKLLENDKNVLFLNLDIKDYFHSVRIPSKTFKIRDVDTVNTLMNEIHSFYTAKLVDEYKYLGDYDFNISEYYCLPIGLVSSFVLGNQYLENFDTDVLEIYKPAYYSRYVDDILFVVSEPNPDSVSNRRSKHKFDFKKYKSENANISFPKKDLTDLERYILNNFYPLLSVVDNNFEDNSKTKLIKISDSQSLYCQSDKTLLYFFDCKQSHTVIDKLKKDLEQRSSEFRDLSSNQKSLSDFEMSSYHLHYEGTEGKIKTLQDYRENRYGLSLFFSSQIFRLLNQQSRSSNKELEQVLSFFKGLNCLQFYTLWEKVLLYFMVSNEPDMYLDFYGHCIEQIEKIKFKKTKDIKPEYIKSALLKHLNNADILNRALNQYFLKENDKLQIIKKTIESKSKLIFDSNIIECLDTKNTNLYRKSNIMRHHYIPISLLNYTKELPRNLLDLKTVHKFELDELKIKNSPRAIKFWQLNLAVVLQNVDIFKRKKCDNGYIVTDILNKEGILNKDFYLDESFRLYKLANKSHFNIESISKTEFLGNTNQNSVNHEYHFSNKNKLSLPKIAFVNTKVNKENIIKGIRNEHNLQRSRYENLAEILNAVRKDNPNIVLFPEFYIPFSLLHNMVGYSYRNQQLVITGLEHMISDDTAFNFVVTILPTEFNGIKDATVVLRLKNHYAHIEEDIIKKEHKFVPKPESYSYDIFNWRNIYFSVFYCFELANSEHRSALKSKVDLLVSVEWNKDTNYFSNIVEATSRDIHCYVAQINTSQYGDTRLCQPKKTAIKDLLRVSGGTNDAHIVTQIDIKQLRDFQRRKFDLTDKRFKPLPPDFSYENVLKRIKGLKVSNND